MITTAPTALKKNTFAAQKKSNILTVQMNSGGDRKYTSMNQERMLLADHEGISGPMLLNVSRRGSIRVATEHVQTGTVALVTGGRIESLDDAFTVYEGIFFILGKGKLLLYHSVSRWYLVKCCFSHFREIFSQQNKIKIRYRPGYADITTGKNDMGTSLQPGKVGNSSGPQINCVAMCLIHFFITL